MRGWIRLLSAFAGALLLCVAVVKVGAWALPEAWTWPAAAVGAATGFALGLWAGPAVLDFDMALGS